MRAWAETRKFYEWESCGFLVEVHSNTTELCGPFHPGVAGIMGNIKGKYCEHCEIRHL